MNEQDFEYLCKLIQDRSAIVLENGKQYLVESRLTPIVRALSLDSIGDLVRQIRSQPNNGLVGKVIEAMVTTETSFFRDHNPFEALRKVVFPDLIEKRKGERRLNLWCAATSTGQEPYSVAMILKEHFPQLKDWKISFLSSDISLDMLARARAGVYTQLEANRGLPASYLVKYFRQEGTNWRLSDDIRSMVDFQEINLARPWPPLPKMDLVLIRNVMIYFDIETKKTILGKIGRLLQPGGYLLLGGAETTFQLDDGYQRVEHLKSGFYQQVK